MKKKPASSGIARRFYAGSKKIALSLMVALFIGYTAYMLYVAFQSQQLVREYVQGFDVSHHQGEITWRKIDKTRYAFVFIKATEGGDYQDPRFQSNWLNAREAGLKVGAYHFFRNCKTGAIQAQNYIRTVPKKADSLPPVMDLEFQWNCPDVTAEQLQLEIATMAGLLEQHYGQKPIFYTTPKYYQAYIQGRFDDYPLWIQDTDRKLSNRDKRPWLFWQYSHSGQIAGIKTAVDMNVFRGNAQQFREFTASRQLKRGTEN